MGRSSRAGARLTRDRILDAAERLFSHQTVSSVSISAIALEATVSHKGVYWHFATKSDLLIATLNRAHRPIGAHLAHAVRQTEQRPAVETLMPLAHSVSICEQQTKEFLAP